MRVLYYIFACATIKYKITARFNKNKSYVIKVKTKTALAI